MKKVKQSDHIDAILFDMVGVLLHKKEAYVSNSINQINADNIEKLYNHVDDLLLIKDIKDKLHLTDKQISAALPYIPMKFEKFIKLWDILPILKKKYKLAIINNGNAIARDYWEKMFHFNIFDIFVNSAIVKYKKPDPHIYLLTCKKLHVDPKRCLFMDDVKENIETARKLGMKVLWWNSENSKEDNLKSFINLISNSKAMNLS